MRSDLFLCIGSLPKAGEGERSADGFAVRFFTFHVFQQFFKVDDEQRQRGQDGDRICDRFREEDGEHLIAEEMRQDVDEWDQHDDLSEDGQEGADLGVAESDEGLLAGTCSPISRTPAM